MNYPIAATFGLICLAFFAHMTGGLRDSLSVRPSRNGKAQLNGCSSDKMPHDRQSADRIERNWVQLMCAFQLVSVDLVAFAVILFLLAFTDHLQPASMIASGIALVFALWGITWLLQLLSLKRSKVDYLLLGHWVFWFLCSGLLFWGAQTL